MSRHGKMSSGLAKDLSDATQLLEQFQQQAELVAAALAKTGDAAGGMIRETADAMVKTLEQITKDTSKAQGDIAAAQLLAATRQIETVLSPLDRSLDQTFVGLLKGTQSVNQGLQALGQSLVAEEISMNEKRLSNWVATEAAKTLASLNGDTARKASTTASTAAGKAAQDASASGSIFSSAKQAAAGAYAAVAQIPIIGPVLAPAAAATAFGAVLAFDVTSAAGGWDRVPADGMMAELHKNEMVLPAGLAGNLRDSLSSRGSGGPLTLNYAPSLGSGGSAMSRGDAEAFFRTHGDLMIRHLKNAQRNGRFAP